MMFYYEDLFKELQKEKVHYVIVGGLAVVLHGIVRLTVDLDLIVALNEENVQRFAKAMTHLGYQPKAPVPPEQLGNAQKRQDWIDNKNMVVFSFFHPKEHYKLIYVFVTEPIPFQKLDKDKKMVKIVEGLEIPICSLPHLIELKKKAGRPQDLADIRALKKLRS